MFENMGSERDWTRRSAAERFAEAARQATASGKHRRAAALYRAALLILGSGIEPSSEDAPLPHWGEEPQGTEKLGEVFPQTRAEAPKAPAS